MALTYKQQFIKFMVENGVLKFGEFTLKSGRKAPYFERTKSVILFSYSIKGF